MRRWWWGTTKDIQTRQEAAAKPEADDDVGVDAEPVLITHRRRPAKKDTRRWCRGKVGREHTLKIAVPPNAHQANCGWRTRRHVDDTYPPSWSYFCRHAELCTVCGKVFRRYFDWLHEETSGLHPVDCPEFTPHWP